MAKHMFVNTDQALRPRNHVQKTNLAIELLVLPQVEGIEIDEAATKRTKHYPTTSCHGRRKPVKHPN
jgi:hypothetical protein